jgi:outer membrane protein assembly factor BamB
MSKYFVLSGFGSLILCAALGGCSKKHPVSEVSLKQSGVTITERGLDADLTWPSWRGPNGDGTAPDQPLLTVWDESTNIVWRADVPGRGHGSPIVVGDFVYLATALESEQKQQVIAFGRQSGETMWTTVLHRGGFPSQREVHHKGTHANGTVACDGERLLIAFLNSDSIIASALDLDGNLIWQREIGKFVSKFGYAPSPVLYKSLVIFAADNMGGGYLAALDAETGTIAWRVGRGNVSSYSSPAVANVGGRDQLLIGGCDAVASYDPATGQELWKTSCLTEATCGTVVTTSELIFAAGGYPERETICLNSEGEKLWSNGTKVYEPSLSVAGDRVIAVTDDGISYCWESGTGDVVWRERLGGKFSASPLLCNGLAYVPNLNGETFVFSTRGDRFELVAKNQLGSDCYASPVAADGQLFLRIGVGQGPDRREQLVCLSDLDPTKAGE